MFDISPEDVLKYDISEIDNSLCDIDKNTHPQLWAEKMNHKGNLLTNIGDAKAAHETLTKASAHAQGILKLKVYLNMAKNLVFAKQYDTALKVLDKALEYQKTVKDPESERYLGFAHMMQGKAFTKQPDKQRDALVAFSKSEYFLEKFNESRWHGIVCMELGRINVAMKNMPAAIDLFKKAEQHLTKAAAVKEEKLGVTICKAVTLWHMAKQNEASQILNDVYNSIEDFGKGKYTIPDLVNVYIDMMDKDIQMQAALI